MQLIVVTYGICHGRYVITQR